MKYNHQQLVTARAVILVHDVTGSVLEDISLREITVWSEHSTSYAKLSKSIKWLTSSGLALVKDRYGSFSVAIPLSDEHYLPVKDVVVHRDVQELLTPAILYNAYVYALRVSLENSRKVTVKPHISKEDHNKLLYAITNHKSTESIDTLVQRLNKSLSSYEFTVKNIVITGEHATVTFIPTIWTQAAESAVILCGLPTYTIHL